MAAINTPKITSQGKLPHYAEVSVKWISDKDFSEIIDQAVDAYNRGRLTECEEYIGQRCIKIRNAIFKQGIGSLIKEAKSSRCPREISTIHSRIKKFLSFLSVLGHWFYFIFKIRKFFDGI
jgi:hypothetical protein